MYICLGDYQNNLWKVLLVHFFAIGWSAQICSNADQRRALFDLFVADVCSRDINVSAVKARAKEDRTNRKTLKVSGKSKVNSRNATPKKTQEVALEIFSESEDIGIHRPKKTSARNLVEDTYSQDDSYNVRSGSENMYGDDDE